MNDFLNRYSGWLSILAIVLSVPIGIGINLVSPKVEAWFAFRSTKRRLKRIQVLEHRIAEVESFNSQPVLAISKFANLSHKGLARQFALVLLFIVAIASLVAISYFSRPESVFSQYLNTPMLISAGPLLVWTTLVVFLLSVALVRFVLGPTFELQELTYRVENFSKWKQQAVKEIEELRKRATG